MTALPATLQSLALARQAAHADPVAGAFAVLSGRGVAGAVSWLRRDYNAQMALAIQAHNQVEAWARRESYAAAIRAALQQLPTRSLDWDLITEHHELDQVDDGWRINWINYQTEDARRQWCRAAARFHAVNAQLMVACKTGD